MAKNSYSPRILKAQMVLNGQTLREVASKARVNYTMASEILSGVRLDPARLQKLAAVILRAPKYPGSISAPHAAQPVRE